jgi:hypothetical protein
MRKLKLDLDSLAVEAFDTAPADASDGTVIGHGPTVASCWISCNGTCPAPCTGGFHTECCTDGACIPKDTYFDETCGEVCTYSCTG